MMPDSDVLDIENLHKSYGRLRVLRGLTLRLRRGEVYGILGSTGAGKSTLIHMLMGFLKPSDGIIQIFGTTDLETSRQRVGYLPEQVRYHLRYTAREYLTFLGRLSNLNGAPLNQRVEAALTRTGLGDAADQRLATFSRGMLQRIGIAQALLANPPLLLLDEPTGGLDPVSRHEVLDILARLRSPERTILLCTHHIDEIEYLCDRAGVLINGRLVVEVDVPQVRGISPRVTIHLHDLPEEVREALNRLSPAVHCYEHQVMLNPNNPSLQEAVLRTLLDAHVEIVALEPLERPLEHVYLEAIRLASSRPPKRKAPPPPPAPASPPSPPSAPSPVDLEKDSSRASGGHHTEPPGDVEDPDALLKELLKKPDDQ